MQSRQLNRSASIQNRRVSHSTTTTTRIKGEKMKISKFANVIAICFCIAIFGQFAQSEQHGAKTQPTGSVLNQPAKTPPVTAFAVGVESITFNGKKLKNSDPYRGFCPVNIVINFLVQASAPTTIKYHIVRSDQPTQPQAPEKVKVPKGNINVIVPYGPWSLGANIPNFQNYRGSVTLVVDSPKSEVGSTSQVGAGFNLKCDQAIITPTNKHN
jgi:hypothetical protein